MENKYIDNSVEVAELNHEIKRLTVLRKIAHQKVEKKSQEIERMKSQILEKEYELWVEYQQAKKRKDQMKGTEFEDVSFSVFASCQMMWAGMKRFVEELSLEEERDSYHKERNK